MESVKVKKSKKPIILGVVSLITWLIPVLGAITSIFGITVSLKRKKECECNKSYKIGFILSVIGLILTICNFIIGFYLQMVMMG